jgi:hypothetical protein
MILFDAEMPVGLAFEQAESSYQNGQRQTWRSPAEVGAGIHKDLAEFQKNSSKEALREFMREACKEDLIQALHHNADGADGVNASAPSDIVEYLIDRGLIKPPSRLAESSRWRPRSAPPCAPKWTPLETSAGLPVKRNKEIGHEFYHQDRLGGRAGQRLGVHTGVQSRSGFADNHAREGVGGGDAGGNASIRSITTYASGRFASGRFVVASEARTAHRRFRPVCQREG